MRPDISERIRTYKHGSEMEESAAKVGKGSCGIHAACIVIVVEPGQRVRNIHQSNENCVPDNPLIKIIMRVCLHKRFKMRFFQIHPLLLRVPKYLNQK